MTSRVIVMAGAQEWHRGPRSPLTSPLWLQAQFLFGFGYILYIGAFLTVHSCLVSLTQQTCQPGTEIWLVRQVFWKRDAKTKSNPLLAFPRISNAEVWRAGPSFEVPV